MLLGFDIAVGASFGVIHFTFVVLFAYCLGVFLFCISESLLCSWYLFLYSSAILMFVVCRCGWLTHCVVSQLAGWFFMCLAVLDLS